MIAVRRILYLHNILKRHETELIRRVYCAMKNETSNGDWIELVANDMKEINLDLSDEEISQFSKQDFKSLIKNRMRNIVFSDLEIQKSDHSKVRNIIHTDLKTPQKYLTNGIFTNKMSSLLLNFRCKSVNEFRSNLESSDQHSPCKFCMKSDDTQEHALVCTVVKTHLSENNTKLVNSVSYMDLFGSIDAQLIVTEAFSIIIKTRENLRKYPVDGLPGHNSGPNSL